MIGAGEQFVLSVNSGSSSLKLRFFQADAELRERASIVAEGIGTVSGRITSSGLADESSGDDLDLPDHTTAIRAVLGRLKNQRVVSSITGVGHRVVHGGRRFTAPGYLVDDSMLAVLAGLAHLAPEHMPQALTAIGLFRAAFSSIPHVACFDTAFHRTMSPLAQQYPLPDTPITAAITRFGFHGLSCESVLMRLRALDPVAAEGKVVIAHLGNGASMTALRNGESVDTTMGFSPTGGLMMGSRTGDIDPGVLLYLMTADRMSAEEIGNLVNKRSGLRGVSGATSDMRDLLEMSHADPKADNAIALYCYLARKQLGALVTVLGGLETLVFTGGIGEHAPPIRAGICTNLEFLGIALDSTRNERDRAVISADGVPVTVRVIETDEDRMIALHTVATIKGEDHDVSV